MSHFVINGNNIDLLKNYPDNYFDAVVTDPPYGLGKEPIAEELMKDWIEHGYHEISGSGFMGKEWDAFVPQPIFWKEVFRVLKHGGHVLAFYGTRTYDWGVMSMRFAGFEVRDCIQWLYGSGFPKSHNISKALDKMEGAERKVVGSKITGGIKRARPDNAEGFSNPYTSGQTMVDITAPSTDSAKQWDGWGTALKPANEPIVLARKPLEKGLSIAENILKWGVGGINIDASRVGTQDKIAPVEGGIKRRNKINQEMGFRKYENGFDNQDKEAWEQNAQGRFPANIIFTHHEDCVCKGTKKVKSVSAYKSKDGYDNESIVFNGNLNSMKSDGYADADGNETIENWDCHEDCPIRILDEQSGVLKSGKLKQFVNGGNFNVFGKQYPRFVETIGDKGGASRFFYVAKASKSERNKGLDDFEAKRSSAYGYEIGLGEKGEGMFKDRNPIKQNFHPTVKPIKLMQYLVKMITPPNGIVLDPFCGSGTTGVACKLDGFQFVGLEQDPEYCKIAQGRIDNFIPEKEELKEAKATIKNQQQTKLF